MDLYDEDERRLEAAAADFLFESAAEYCVEMLEAEAEADEEAMAVSEAMEQDARFLAMAEASSSPTPAEEVDEDRYVDETGIINLRKFRNWSCRVMGHGPEVD